MPFTYKHAQLNYMHMLNSEHFSILYLPEFSYNFFSLKAYKRFCFQEYLLTLTFLSDHSDWFLCDIFII